MTDKLLQVKVIIIITLAIYTTNCNCQNNDTISYLYDFAKLTGYVQFFHPSDECSDVDYFDFTYYGVKKILENKTKPIENILDELFCSIAPTLKITNNSSQSFNKKILFPDNNEYNKIIAWQHTGYSAGNTDNVYQSKRTNRHIKTINQVVTSRVNISPDIFLGDSIQLMVKGNLSKSKGATANITIGQEDNKNFRIKNNNIVYDPVRDSLSRWYVIKTVLQKNTSRVFIKFDLWGEGTLQIDSLLLLEKQANDWFPINYLLQFANAQYSIDSTHFVITNQCLPKFLDVNDLFKEHANIGDYYTLKLAGALKCYVPLALYGNDTATFPPVPQNEFIAFKNKIKYPIIDIKDPIYRMACIIQIWNVFKHFHPYLRDLKLDWDNQLKKSLLKTWHDSTFLQFKETLKFFVGPIEDGHTFIIIPEKERWFLPMSVDMLSDKFIITEIFDSSLISLEGAEILRINGVSLSQLIARKQDYIYDTSLVRNKLRIVRESLEGKKIEVISVDVRKGDLIKNYNITCSLNSSDYAENLTLLKNPSYKILDDSTYYLNIDKITAEEFEKINFSQNKSKRIILDFRNYPNPEVRKVLSHFFKKKKIYPQHIFLNKIINPDDIGKIKDKGFFGYIPEKPYVNGKLYLLMSNYSISACETYIGHMNCFKNAVLTGETTMGANGKITNILLPGSIRVNFTGMVALKPDGTALYRKGYIPDIKIDGINSMHIEEIVKIINSKNE